MHPQKPYPWSPDESGAGTGPDETRDDPGPRWTVGELAERAGVTVRTLHHYDELGLLPPRERSRAGYRIYGPEEVERLQTVLSLKAAGLELEQIAEALERPGTDLRSAVELHLTRLEEELERGRALRDKLRAVLAWSDRRGPAAERGGAVSVDLILETLEMTTMYETYYTDEQMETLAARRKQLGEETIRAVEAEWPELIAKAKAAMEAGHAPDSEAVRPIARRWKELVEMFTGGDATMERSVGELYQGEPEVREKTGLDMEVMGFMGRAMGALEE